MALEHIKKKLSEQEQGKKRTKQVFTSRGRKITIITAQQRPQTFSEWARQVEREDKEAAAEAGFDPSATNNPSMEESFSERREYQDNPNDPLYGLRIHDTSCRIQDEAYQGLNCVIPDESLEGLGIPKSARRGLDISLY